MAVQKSSPGRTGPSKVKNSKVKKKLSRKSHKKDLKKSKKKAAFFKCPTCLGYLKLNQKKNHYCEKPTELSLIKVLDQDGRDAWAALKNLAASFGEQRVYASAKAIMFSRRICFCFVRPKPKGLEMVFFLNQKLDHPLIKRVQEYSKTKFAHTIKLVHEDQIEEPITDWLRQAFNLAL